MVIIFRTLWKRFLVHEYQPLWLWSTLLFNAIICKISNSIIFFLFLVWSERAYPTADINFLWSFLRIIWDSLPWDNGGLAGVLETNYLVWKPNLCCLLYCQHFYIKILFSFITCFTYQIAKSINLFQCIIINAYLSSNWLHLSKMINKIKKDGTDNKLKFDFHYQSYELFSPLL